MVARNKKNGQEFEDLIHNNWIVECLTREKVDGQEIGELVVRIPRQVLYDLGYKNHVVRTAYRTNRDKMDMPALEAMRKALWDYEKRLTHGGYCPNW